jgi:hypothetical protein
MSKATSVEALLLHEDAADVDELDLRDGPNVEALRVPA